MIATIFPPNPPMSDRLFLRLAPDGSLTWLRASGDARAATSLPGAPPASALAQAREVVVFVPAADVLVTRATLAARHRAQLLKALPFAVEDGLLAPVETLHFAASAAQDGEVGVAVVARSTLEGWLDRLAEAGIEADAIVPESLALPPGALLLEDDRATARTAPWTAFACAPGELADWLAQAPPDVALDVHDVRAAAPLALPAPVAAYHERQRDALAFLAANIGAPPLNLLDGEFSPRRRRRNDAGRIWRIAAALAAAVVGLAVLSLGAQVWTLSRESARLDAAARDAVTQAFPDLDAKIFDRLTPAQLVLSRADRGGSTPSSGALGVLERIGPILTNGSTRIQTRALDFRNGMFELALRAPDLNALDLVRERIAMLPGMKAELTAANPGAEGVDGRIRIDAGASAKAAQR